MLLWGQFVDERYLGMTREDGVNVHLVKGRAFVIDLAGGNVFKFCREFGGAFATMGFDDPDDDVFSALAAANALREHAEGLSHAGSVAEKNLKAAASLFRLGSDQPVFGTFPRCGIGWQVVLSPCELTSGGRSIPVVGGSIGADRNCSRISPMAAC